MAGKPFLVTLLPSVDVDLGRWLLQCWRRDYAEHPHAPVFHILALNDRPEIRDLFGRFKIQQVKTNYTVAAKSNATAVRELVIAGGLGK